LDCFLNQDETVLGCRKRLPIVRHDPATGIYHNRDNPVSVGIDERDYWLVSGRNHSRSARTAELAGYLGELGAFADRIANAPLGVDRTRSALSFESRVIPAVSKSFATSGWNRYRLVLWQISFSVLQTLRHWLRTLNIPC
jgi:hypothetical protein